MNETTPSTENGALVIFDRQFTPATLFVPGTLDPLIEHIRQQVKSEVTDSTTPAGRARIKSLAYKVTTTKTTIDNARKQLVSDEKKRLAIIDAEGRRVWNILEELADEVRRPVTEYEEREKRRVEAHKAACEAIRQFDFFASPPATADLEKRLSEAAAVSTDHEEFTDLAKKEKEIVIKSLTEKLAISRKADADRAELERLRKEAVEREQREREERAAAKAKAAAEEVARIREEVARKAAEAEKQRLLREAEEREKKMRAEAEAKERAAAAELARVEREKIEAKEAAEKAARDAERRAEEAVEMERQRREKEQRAEEEAARKREADKAHRAKINNAAVAALVQAGLANSDAKLAVTIIAKGGVPHVTIAY